MSEIRVPPSSTWIFLARWKAEDVRKLKLQRHLCGNRRNTCQIVCQVEGFLESFLALNSLHSWLQRTMLKTTRLTVGALVLIAANMLVVPVVASIHIGLLSEIWFGLENKYFNRSESTSFCGGKYE